MLVVEVCRSVAGVKLESHFLKIFDAGKELNFVLKNKFYITS